MKSFLGLLFILSVIFSVSFTIGYGYKLGVQMATIGAVG